MSFTLANVKWTVKCLKFHFVCLSSFVVPRITPFLIVFRLNTLSGPLTYISKCAFLFFLVERGFYSGIASRTQKIFSPR